jgi:uncharacterized protein (TIGR03382 family)
MKNVIASLVAVAGLSVAANAATTVSMLVSTDGVNFGQNVALPADGTARTVQVLVSVSTTASNALGLGSMIFQPTVSNWNTGNTASFVPLTTAFGSNTSTPAGAVNDEAGQYGRIRPWAQIANTSAQALTGHTLNTGAPGSFLRIAQAQVTGWIGAAGNTSGGSGVNIKQLNNIGRTASDPAFNGSITNVHVFRFAVSVSSTNLGNTLVVDAPLGGFGNYNSTTQQREVYWYGDMNEASGSVREVATVASGAITFIPAPGAMALLGLGGLAVARRRR